MEGRDCGCLGLVVLGLKSKHAGYLPRNRIDARRSDARGAIRTSRLASAHLRRLCVTPAEGLSLPLISSRRVCVGGPWAPTRLVHTTKTERRMWNNPAVHAGVMGAARNWTYPLFQKRGISPINLSQSERTCSGEAKTGLTPVFLSALSDATPENCWIFLRKLFRAVDRLSIARLASNDAR
jgi:hypothetical protein